MVSGVAPFQTPETLPNAWDALNGDLNSYASRGFPMSMPLADAYESHAVGTVGAATTLGSLEPFYILGASNQSALTTAAFTTNRLHAIPFVHEHGFRLSRIGFSCVTGAGSATAVLGIYDSKTEGGFDLYPNRRLWNSAAFAPTASGVTHENTANLDLTPGSVYWAVYLCGTAAPTLRALPATILSTAGAVTAGSGILTPSTYIYVALAYTATLPANFPTGGVVTSGVAPAIHVALSKGGVVLASTRPLWASDADGWTLRSSSLLAGSTKQSGASSLASLGVTLRLRTGAGARDLGAFDSRTQKVGPGDVFPLTRNADIPIPRGSILEAYVEQRGWPVLSVADCSVTWTLARTGV